MNVVTPAEMKAWAKRKGIDETPLFSRATNRDIAIRMLNNVRFALSNRDRNVDALRVLDYKALLANDRPEIFVERSEVWLDLGDTGMAREMLEHALKLIDTQSYQDAVRRRIQLLSQIEEVLN
jgi:regulator of sirC expression with transglutaminase-like and TPR domain